ncbi:MAG: hypothetical protein L6R42_003624 [Xanthoria sp. 1 TBL-2021]|nr:MAG: hypothetical protein L6R42_003624 [Xanthoria sp. 1 TBL-2021]
MSAGGLEYAAGAGGLISLSLTLFRGCVRGFELIQLAAHAGSEADNFRCKLEVEQYRLMQWAEHMGLEETPNDRLNWTLIGDILKQMEALLLDTQTLKKKYRLDLVPVDNKALAPETSALAAAPPVPKTGFGKMLSKLRPDFPLASSRIIDESNGSVKKLRWAVFDRAKAASLVNDIVHFNNCLHGLLDNVNQEFVKSALGSVLRDIISRSNATSELEIIKQLLGSSQVAAPAAVASAASLKQIRLVLGLGPSHNSIEQSAQRAPPEGIKIKLIQLKPHLLQRESPQLPPNERELARYKAKPVVIEWKFVDRAHEKELKTRVDQVAILLAHTYDPSYHSLHCIGFLPKDVSYQPDDENTVCYGLVFELTISSSIPPRIAPVVRPLSTLFADARKPNLNERRDIALALAETILQLHTSGWLHKGIRSDNVLYIDTGDSKWEYCSANGPFLAGYEYARPTTAHTEAMPTNPDQEMYRHPKGQGLTRSNFRRSFDLFALGCVLLEIGLWSNLSEILQRVPSESTGQEHETITSTVRPGKVDWVRLHTAKMQLLQNDDFEKRSELAGIAFHAGKTFQDVIVQCLYADDEDPLDEDISVQKEIVDLLRRSTF